MKGNYVAATGRSRLGRRLSWVILACAVLAVASCLSPAPQLPSIGRAAPAPDRTPPLAIVIVTLDGVRWQEVFDGVDPVLARERGLPRSAMVSAARLMPNLHSIIDTHGVALGAPGHGAAISASGPNFVSLPGYAELLSGRRWTACRDNQCSGSATRTIVDELSAGTTLDHPNVAVITSWAEIDRVASLDAPGALISSGRHGGSTRDWFSRDPRDRYWLERAESADPAPGSGDFRPDALTADLALHHLRAHPTRFLFLGLGEPDEFGHRGDYAGYLAALRSADVRIAEIDAELRLLAGGGTRTALFITADHGRADSFNDHGSTFPESARVWLVASGNALRTDGLLSAPRQRWLADLAPTVRQIAGLASDSDPRSGTALLELLRPD